MNSWIISLVDTKCMLIVFLFLDISPKLMKPQLIKVAATLLCVTVGN